MLKGKIHKALDKVHFLWAKRGEIVLRLLEICCMYAWMPVDSACGWNHYQMWVILFFLQQCIWQFSSLHKAGLWEIVSV